MIQMNLFTKQKKGKDRRKEREEKKCLDLWYRAALARKQKVKSIRKTLLVFKVLTWFWPMGPTCHSRRLRAFRVVTMVCPPGHPTSAFSGRWSRGHKCGLTGDKGTGRRWGGGPPLTSASPGPGGPRPGRWAQQGLAQPLTTHRATLAPARGLAAWTEGAARAGAQRTWTLSSCQGSAGPSAARRLPALCRLPPSPAQTPGGVQPRVTCFCSRPDSPGAWSSWALWPGPQGTHHGLAGTVLEDWVPLTEKLAWASGSLFARVLPKSPPEAPGPRWKMFSDPEEAPKIPLPHFRVCLTYIYSFCVLEALWLLLWFDHFGFVLSLRRHWSVFTSGQWQLW